MGETIRMAPWGVAAVAALVLSGAGCSDPSEPTADTRAKVLGLQGETGAPLLQVVLLDVALPEARDDIGHRQRVADAQDDLLHDLPEAAIDVVYRYRFLPGLTVRLRDPAVLDAIAAHPRVLAVGPDVPGGVNLNQSVPFVGASVVHGLGLTGVGRKVAVIDTGADVDHPDLVDDLVDGACFCATGTNCCGPSGSTGLGLTTVEDDTGHGSHVSGIITGGGVVAPVGVAPDAQVVIVRVMRNGRFQSASDMLMALDWIRTAHPDVDAVNMSLGTLTRYPADCELAGPGYTPPAFVSLLWVAMQALRQVGAVPVAASGNDADKVTMSAPACLSNVMAVGASGNSSDVVAGYSNSNDALDVWAPGSQILSAYLAGGTISQSGTSMATPHVAATVALTRQANRFHPPATVEGCVTTSTVVLTDAGNGIARPRLDVAAAVAACADFGNGSACTLGAECASGFCVDGVCCNTACGGAGVDCLGCSVSAGSAVDGQCQTAASGTVCRANAGTCDLAESCDGVATTCPADRFEPFGLACRPSGGDCDLPESCPGNGPACPFDAKFGGICRPALGPCDRSESCDGVADACPPDLLWGLAIECRPSAGACDPAELCSGTSTACPSDVLSSGVCRPSAGDCDAMEQCDGTSPACPQDILRPSGTVCRAAVGVCDRVEQCDGATAVCPADAKRSSVCRPAAGRCDLTEFCPGDSDECPADALMPFAVRCRESGGACDAPEACTGVDPICPPDEKRRGVCRASSAPCDVAEVCDGAADECPADRVASSTVTCRPAAHACDAPELCDGVGIECPDDALASEGTACPDDQACDGTEVCRAGVCVDGAPVDCEDGDPCTAGACEEPGGCVQTAVPGCCSAAGDCDDEDACTLDVCSGPGGTCRHELAAGCCAQAADCDDGDTCTLDLCPTAGGACVFEPIRGCCASDADCAGLMDRCGAATCEQNQCVPPALADCPANEGCSCRARGGRASDPGGALWLVLLLAARPRSRRLRS